MPAASTRKNFPTTRSIPAIPGFCRRLAGIIGCATASIGCSVNREEEMDFETYKNSLGGASPPAGLGLAAQALWWDAEGDWAHAYLHRVEGDLRNAGGWYGRAGRPMSTAPLKEEWETIARTLLG